MSKPSIEGFNGYIVIRGIKDEYEDKTTSGILLQGQVRNKEKMEFGKVLKKNDKFPVGTMLVLNNHSIRKFTYLGYEFEVVHERDVVASLKEIAD